MNQLLAMNVFVRVVETGSFSKAADQLVLPRSSVSKLVSDLEKHLGITLIQRTTRAVSPTAEGLEYYQRVVKILEEVQLADSAVKGQKLKPRGHLRIDTPSILANHLLIPALADFHRHYPDVTLSIGISDRTVNIVGEGVDCVIRTGELPDMALVGRPLFRLKYLTCATAAYLAENGTPSSPKDLKQHRKLGYFYPATGRPEPLMFERGNERYRFDSFDFSTNEGNGLTALIRTGLGIGQHIAHFLQPHIDSGELVTILNDWSRPTVPFHLIYPANRHQSTRHKVFTEWLIDYFSTADIS